MESITFTCELITPLFMSGADGTTPELRAPSIKGALRFWWRAMNGHLDLNELRKRESKIFGDTTQRSKIIIQKCAFTQRAVISNEKKVPHKPFANAAFSARQSFELIIGLQQPLYINGLVFDNKSLESLVYLTFTLGGLGNRSRRGYGSLTIKGFETPTIDGILAHLECINPKFEKNTEGSISRIKSNFGRVYPYPFIKEIEIGRPQSNLIQKIADTTHTLLKNNGRVYQATLGLAARERFASPIYVSAGPTLSNNAPIITTLNTVPPDFYKREVNLSLQKVFKRNVL